MNNIILFLSKFLSESNLFVIKGSEEEDPLKMHYDSDEFDEANVSRDSQVC